MLTILTSGESHGPQLTTVVDGLPAGMTVDVDAINLQLARRQKGYGRGGRMKIERDTAEVVSGLRSGITLGGPVTLVIRNRDWQNWSRIMDPVKPLPDDLDPSERSRADDTRSPRPGHADLAGGIKLGHHDLRNVLERASARETAARVAGGSLGRQLLEGFGVSFASHVVRIGSVALPSDFELPAIETLAERTERSPVRCADAGTEERMVAAIDAAMDDHNSLGGIAEIIVRGLPAGLGGFSQWYHRLDGRLAGALMSIQSVKGVEVGLGVHASEMFGSQVHDEIFSEPDGDPVRKRFSRKTNNAGGIEGGITNGEDIVLRIAGKPISTLSRPLKTINVETRQPAEAIVERTDCCVAPALAVIGEAVAASVLADAFLHKFGSDNMAETERHYRSWLAAEY